MLAKRTPLRPSIWELFVMFGVFVLGLQDPARRARMGAAGRQVAIEQYGLPLQTERYLELYAAMRGEVAVRSAAPTPPRRPPTA